jgi:hypothetical protein
MSCMISKVQDVQRLAISGQKHYMLAISKVSG